MGKRIDLRCLDGYWVGSLDLNSFREMKLNFLQRGQQQQRCEAELFARIIFGLFAGEGEGRERWLWARATMT